MAEERFSTSGVRVGHSQRRILHVQDATGREIERALSAKANDTETIHIYENCIAIDLIKRSKVVSDVDPSHDRCIGAYVYDIDHNRVRTFTARFVVLATGGAGKVYLVTTNPDIATGDGMAIAYRAGAAIANMEFIQFHPTCLFHPDAKAFLISEAVRGEGGILKLRNGQTFMENYHPLKSLAPRDIVARAIDHEMKRRGDEFVLLDITHHDRDYIINRFPNIYEKCRQYGIDMTREPIPVAPAAHYFCGGVQVNAMGETTIPGLLACGEVTCTGLHGANRLASNSLLESVVYAHRVYERIRALLPSEAMETPAIPAWDTRGATASDEAIVVAHNWDEIRRSMSNYVGIVRSNRRLERAAHRIDLVGREIDEYYKNFLISRDLLELRNIALVAQMVVRCAILRKESRGLHYNLDYPETNEGECLRDTVIYKQDVRR